MNPSLMSLRPGDLPSTGPRHHARGEPLPAAVQCSAGRPAVALYVGGQKCFRYDQWTSTPSPGPRGAPIHVVQAQTVDWLVPAEAEIVIEGYIDPTLDLEPEAPFGESHGHVTCRNTTPIWRSPAITHRAEADLDLDPHTGDAASESSLIKHVGDGADVHTHHLRDVLKHAASVIQESRCTSR